MMDLLRRKLHRRGLPNDREVARRIEQWKAITGRDLTDEVARQRKGTMR